MYEDKQVLYKFFNELCINYLSVNEYEKYLEKIDYSTFFKLIKENIKKIRKIISSFPLEYIKRKETIEFLATSKYSLCSLNYFERLKNENCYADLNKTFSFILNLSKEEIKIFIKPNEDINFINYISENVNSDYFNDLSFSISFLPFNIKRLLIDEICKKYKYDCLDFFQGEYDLLTIDEIVKLFTYSSFSKTELCMQELKEKNHPLFLEPDKLINLILKNYRLLNFINLEDLSLQNLKLISSKINISI